MLNMYLQRCRNPNYDADVDVLRPQKVIKRIIKVLSDTNLLARSNSCASYNSCG